MNIILYGFKSCGKTTIGQKLAVKLERPFYDTDQLVEALFEKISGKKLCFRKIYQQEGAYRFSLLEQEVLEHLKGVDSSIFSIGGSCALKSETRALLQQLGMLIYLKIDPEQLRKRIFSAELPAFFDSLDPESSFKQMVQERSPLYEEISPFWIDVSKKTEEQILLELAQYLESPYGK